MIKIIYVTSNNDKFLKAKKSLKKININLIQKKADLKELQEKGAEIALDKARQAFQEFQQPVIVSDDSWITPSLNGFPGEYMKQMAQMFKVEDWLLLMKNKKDRRIFLDSYIAYKDKHTEKVFSYRDERYFLKEAKGEHKKSPPLTIIACKNSSHSIAEQIAKDSYEANSHLKFWKKLAEFIKKANKK